MNSVTDHAQLVSALKRAVLAASALTPPKLRQAAAVRASGGPAIDTPYDALVQQIGASAYRVTDAQVAAVLTVAGSEKAVFEIIAAAAVGAGFQRWDAGLTALQEAINEAA